MGRTLRLDPVKPTLSAVARVVNLLLLGRVNSTGEITLTASSATSTIERPYITAQSVVLLMPTTANAGSETFYISCTNGVATLYHTNSAVADRTFKFAVLGG
jgi:hypothetical protein